MQTFNVVSIDRKELDSGYGRWSRKVGRMVGKKMRVHFEIVQDDRKDLFEKFAERGTEPHKEFKKVMPEVLYQLGLEGVEFSWNRYAGCSMCPCSPGFVVESYSQPYKEDFVWVRVDLKGAIARKLDPRYVATAERLQYGGL